MNYLLKNGTIVDGSNSKSFKGNIVINNELIETITTDEIIDFPGIEIDCEGLVIAPGFIDGHSHNDWMALCSDKVLYGYPMVCQGITSAVAGNCGVSATGFNPDCNFAEVGGDSFSLDQQNAIPSFADWYHALHNNTPLNMTALIGHGTIRASVADLSDKELTKEEHDKMMFLLEKGLKEGAAGISVGLMYRPGIFASKEEMIEIAKLCKKYNKPMSFHNRANSAVSMGYKKLLGRPHLLRALDELVEIGQKTGCQIHNSHLIFVGKSSWKCVDEALKLLEDLDKSKIKTSFDLYSSECGASTITVILPKWYQALPFEKRNNFWVKIKLSVMVAITKKLLGFDFEDIQIAYCGENQKELIGKNIRQIAKEKKQSCLKTYLEICEKNNYKGRIYLYKYYNQKIIERLAKHPLANYMTDAWYEKNGIQNPSVFNCYPKFLRLALDGKTTSLEEAVHKMTGKIADLYNIKQRGLIKIGNFADITIFDPKTVQSVNDPDKRPLGIKEVFINGKHVMQNGNVNQNILKTSGQAMPIK